MPANRQELLEQLRKLRTLAQRTSATPEGAAALRKLRELMRRYSVTMAEVDLKPAKAPAAKRTPISRASTPATVTLKVGNVRIRWKL